jgi:hypothetical protein
MDPSFFIDRLYPFQDRVLQDLAKVDSDFYLSGGTALSRGYLDHRFSDDLDLFVNDDERFHLWADRCIQTLTSSTRWTCLIDQREDRFIRLAVAQENLSLKIEMINDVPSRIGEPWLHPVLGRIDTAENILANKITAILSREAPKDLADIWGLCCKKKLPIMDAITGAQGKAAGVFPVDLARVLCSATLADWELVRWIEAPEPTGYLHDLDELGKSLILP